jgi:anti-sigma factor RsiW
MTDPIIEADLLSYVDDQLDLMRRIEVEGYLAKNPEAAAQVMTDLKVRDALRIAAFADPTQRQSEPTLGAARRLERALAWRDVGLRLRRVATVALLVGLGWVAHGQIGLGITESEASPKPPAFVEDARHSHETALLRARMVSQPQSAAYDPAEILTETGIKLPVLPAQWRVLDAQVFPSREGHSVEIAIEAGDLGQISLFAAHVPAFNVIPPALARFDNVKAAYWQTGEFAYALTGTGNERAIERAAMRLSHKLQ